MKIFLEWMGTLCGVAALCALVHAVTQKTGAGKVLKLISAAVMVCIILRPIGSLVKDFTLPQISVEEGEETALYDTAVLQMKTLTENMLLSEVNEALASYDIKAEKLEITMDISDEGDISIRDICLFIPESNSLHRSWAAQIAQKRLGRSVTVEFLNGG